MVDDRHLWYHCEATRESHISQSADSFREAEPPPAPHTVESICLFKQGIQPTWEDSANAGGGQWNWRPAVDQQTKGAGLDAIFEELVLAMIGGIALDACNHICGLRVVDKSRPAWGGKGGRRFLETTRRRKWT